MKILNKNLAKFSTNNFLERTGQVIMYEDMLYIFTGSEYFLTQNPVELIFP